MKTWIKRLGFWGFLFFLVKGLLWLTIPGFDFNLRHGLLFRTMTIR